MKRSILAGFAGIVLLASGAAAQQPGQHGDSMNAMRGKGMTNPMMVSRMDSADARLDRLMKTMNASMGDKKVQAMAAVLNELVAQRKMMRMHAREMMGSGMMMGGQGAGAQNKMRSMGPPSGDTSRPAAADTNHAQHHP